MIFTGLLVARAYSICRGDKKIAIALVFGFLSGLILYLYRKKHPNPASNYLTLHYSETIAYSGCDPKRSGIEFIFYPLHNDN